MVHSSLTFCNLQVHIQDAYYSPYFEWSPEAFHGSLFQNKTVAYCNLHARTQGHLKEGLASANAPVSSHQNVKIKSRWFGVVGAYNIDSCYEVMLEYFQYGNLTSLLENYDAVWAVGTIVPLVMRQVFTNPMHIQDLARLGLGAHFAYGCLHNYIFRYVSFTFSRIALSTALRS